MEQNERKNRKIIFVDPEMVEDMPLSRMERIRERGRNIRHRMGRIRLPKAGMIMAAAALALLALLAVPVLPMAAATMLAVSCLRSAFRAQTA